MQNVVDVNDIGKQDFLDKTNLTSFPLFHTKNEGFYSLYPAKEGERKRLTEKYSIEKRKNRYNLLILVSDAHPNNFF